MPRTVEEGFSDFIQNLTPSTSESEAVKKHRDSIRACLEANFDMRAFFATGSFGNGTSVLGYSDTDYFARIPAANLKENSHSSLVAIRQVLENRFPNTGVHVDSPAVVVPFGTRKSETTEIVPADYLHTTKNYNVYDIPDRAGGWMTSSPSAHKQYVTDQNIRLGYKLKPLIRLIKAWKFYRNVPVSSFYLEMRITRYAEGETAIVYNIDVERVLRYLSNCSLASMQDPLGITGYIPSCSSQVKLEDAQSKLSTALARASLANEEKNKGNIETAFYWWRLLYDDHFPTYYR